MTLRKSLLALTLCLFAFNAFSAVSNVEVNKEPVTITPEQAQQAKALMNKLSTVDLSELTIKEAEELAGRKLTLKEKIGFKIAKKKMQKMEKKSITSMTSGNGLVGDAGDPGIDKGIYILLAIFVLPFLAVGLASDWEGNDWLYCLLWTVLGCGIGGMIYALVKMKKYYA
jgi:uncharacterized membrane protein YqaE (UPF0057 family)